MTKAKEVNKNKLLEALDGNQELLDDFLTFQNKEKQKEIKRDLEVRTRDLLETDFQKANDEALEGLNIVFRKAWTQACTDLSVDEAEYPSRY